MMTANTMSQEHVEGEEIREIRSLYLERKNMKNDKTRSEATSHYPLLHMLTTGPFNF